MRVDIRIAENARTDLLQGIETADYFKKMEIFLAGMLVDLVAIPDGTETVELSLSLISEPEMRAVNTQYRGIDSATDVLSFPLWEEDVSGRFAPPDAWEVLPLGDIVICPEFVASAAEEVKRSFLEEFTLVLCHGVLHLCGFDHDSEEGEKKMWDTQDSMVSRFLKGACDAQ